MIRIIKKIPYREAIKGVERVKLGSQAALGYSPTGVMRGYS